MQGKTITRQPVLSALAAVLLLAGCLETGTGATAVKGRAAYRKVAVVPVEGIIYGGRADRGGYTMVEVIKAQMDRAAESDDVVSQAERGMPENVRWRRGGISFAALHVVGGNNGLASWTGARGATPEQTAEVLTRTAGVVEAIHDVFADARASGDRAVVLFMQADLFAPGAAYEGSYAYEPIVQALAREARAFAGPVYLFNGDTHRYAEDRPLQGGSPWLEFYAVRDVVPNLTRVTIDGAENATGYLRVRVEAGDTVLTWRTVRFDT